LLKYYISFYEINVALLITKQCSLFYISFNIYPAMLIFSRLNDRKGIRPVKVLHQQFLKAN